MGVIHRLPSAFHLFPPFVGRELREQYAGSSLGMVWSILQPLLFILLYWWVFSAVLQTRFPETSVLAETPFIVFLLSALLPWFAFQDGLNRAAGAIVSRRDMVCKVHFPVQIFPLAAITAAFVVHVGSYLLFLAVYAVWNGGLSMEALLTVLILLALQFTVTAGLGLLLATLTVYLRDTTQVLGVLLMTMFYTAPILYPLSLVPERFRALIYLNPFATFAEAYHSAVLMGSLPEPKLLFGLGLFGVVSLLTSAYLFRQLEPGFADVL